VLAFLYLLTLLGVPSGLSADDSIKVGDHARYLGAELSSEVAIGGDQEIVLHYQVVGALPPGMHAFLHVASAEGSCRVIRDALVTLSPEGAIEQHFALTMPEVEACGPQRMEVRTGLYLPTGGGREPLDIATVDDRIHAASFDIVDGTPSAAREAVSPGDMRHQRVLGLLRPWRYWLLGLLLSIVVTVFLRRRRKDAEDDEPSEDAEDAKDDSDAEDDSGAEDDSAEDDEPSDAKDDDEASDAEDDSARDVKAARWWWPEGRRARLRVLGPLLVAVGVMIVSIAMALDFVKDDAYITFHYAQNFVNGRGLVFNVGERLEGSTSFLWMLAMVPFEALGLDLFQVTEVLGTLLCVGTLFSMAWLFVQTYGVHKNMAHAWPALWLGTSSTAALWATSGMEGPLGMMLPVLAVGMTFAAVEQGRERLALGAGAVMALGCLTRPEIHLVGMIVGLFLILRAIKARRLDPVTTYWFIGLLGLTAPAHLFRYVYYGGLLPNTYYVKTSKSALVFIAGLGKLHDMFSFNGLGALVLLAPLAFVDKRRTALKTVMALAAVGFMAFIVKVGADEMRWHRLYLPALPFVVLLGMMGLRNLAMTLVDFWKSQPKAKPIAFAVATLLLLVAMGVNLRFTYRSTSGFNGWGELSGTYHPDMGKFVTRHEQPGALVAFQDMGSTPYHAPDLSFLDFFGLVDRTVARARYAYGLHPFAATEAFRNQPAFDADMREYFHRRNPEWAILTSYVGNGDAAAVSERFARDPTPRALGNALRANPYQFRIYDERFREHYVHVRTWPRSASYYLSLFRRRDLYEQTPGEVVLDAPPADLSGVTATFDHNLQMLGSEVEGEALEDQEFFVTTWWRAGGPAEADTHFFLHMESADRRVPYDHIPGDWMYPADRWHDGDIIENRVLMQIPVGVPPGDYQVYLGIYNPSTGARWAIVEGDDVGDGRLLLGSVHVRAQIPFWDSMIKRTDIDEQRHHADRIVHHGRRPGQ